MYRLFVALSLPETVRDAVSQLQFGLPGARWRPEDSFHITLQFIGETDRHGLAEAHSALFSISAPAFDVRLGGCGFFGERKPRALWVGVASEGIQHLQTKVATALSRAGFRPEARKFAPHVTIAYLNGVATSQVAAFCAMHGLFSCGPVPVDAFHLYESRLGGEASHYEILESYALSSSR
jgi:2'-5' RNA ligase